MPPPPPQEQHARVQLLSAALLPPASQAQAERVEAWLASQLASVSPQEAARRSAALAVALARELRIQGTTDELSASPRSPRSPWSWLGCSRLACPGSTGAAPLRSSSSSWAMGRALPLQDG